MNSENWIDEKEYFNSLIKEFPQIKNKILEWEPDVIHMRMEMFADYTMEQIKANDINELKRCFDFQESKIDFIDSNIENALNVSYCESLLLGDCADEMNRIVEYMPEKLKAEYKEYEKYYIELTKS
ncbi:DUF7674 family protein [Aquimarina sp. 433]